MLGIPTRVPSQTVFIVPDTLELDAHVALMDSPRTRLQLDTYSERSRFGEEREGAEDREIGFVQFI